MKTKTLLLLLAGTTIINTAQAADIVKDGKPNAQIVIAAENRPRMATLAALDLRRYIEKISGARLPIVTAPDESAPVKIYVGDSPGAAKVGVTSEGLNHGAFRVASGPDWLALVGDDKDFVPSKLVGVGRGDNAPFEEWKRLTAGKTKGEWAFPASGQGKFRWAPKDFEKVLNTYYGDDSFGLWMEGGNTLQGFWNNDATGSLGAVMEFLYGLGVRIYMPRDDMGTILPKLTTIAVPDINKTVTPDFPCRYWAWYNYAIFPLEDVIWARRLGINDGSGYYTGVHGLTAVHSTDATKKAHPEFYAMRGGKRDMESRGVGTPCFSSDALFQETVNYCRFRFDVLGDDVVDIMPGDGLNGCECEGCKGKGASENVWGFVNRVATELYKTHPDKLVNCGAYSQYRLAPDSIEKFSPNVMVSVYNFGRASFNDPEKWERYTTEIAKFQSKLAPGRLRRGENNLHNGSPAPGRRGLVSFPIIIPNATAKDLKFQKGISFGEGAESPQLPGSWKAPGLDHLALYIQARFLMDVDQDTEKVLNEYYTLFYGPAAKQMREAFEFAEANIATKDKSKSGGRMNPQNVSLDVKLKLRELLEKARAAAGDGIYGDRIAMIQAELKPKELLMTEGELKAQNQVRQFNPLIRVSESPTLENARKTKLVDVSTKAEDAKAPTTVKMGWDNAHLMVEITCNEPDMKNLKAGKPIDQGDFVAVALETPIHSHYLIYVSPDGTLLEGNPEPGGWSSNAEVKVEKGEASWVVKLRIPTMPEAEDGGDESRGVVGATPHINGLWWFNVARQRVRGDQTQIQALPKQARSKEGTWKDMQSFGRLEVR